MIDFEEEIERFKPSLDVEAVEDAIVKSDLTDMTDIMMELIKERDGIWVWKRQRCGTFPEQHSA